MFIGHVFNPCEEKRLIAEVLESSVWHVLFPIGHFPVYVMSGRAWEKKHGCVFSHEEFGRICVPLDDLLAQLGIPDAECPFRPLIKGGIMPMLPTASALDAFAGRVQRHLLVYLCQGNLYHGFTVKQVLEAEPRITAYRG